MTVLVVKVNAIFSKTYYVTHVSLMSAAHSVLQLNTKKLGINKYIISVRLI